MKPSPIHLAAGAAVLALALTGCGSPGGDGASEAASEGGEAAAGTRTVTDSTGAEVEVPAEPERVVTLHYAATQPVFDLGVTPVGQSQYQPGIVPEDLVDDFEAVPVVAEGVEPNLEEIAGLEPDLILAPNVYEEEVVEQLEAVAPVYVFTLRGGDRAKWFQRTEEVADALGVPEKADELAAEFAARQQEIADTYADVIDGKTVGVIGAFEENSFYAWGEESMSGTLLVPLGFTWSAQEGEAVAAEAEPEATVSNESLDSVVGDVDVLFYDSDLRGEVNPFMADLQETTLYQELPAVQDGHAYPAGKNTVAGYTDANYTLDRVVEALEDLQTP
ncbi:ABC transporter substrate-binding protein [Nocardiopsis sp. CNT312]|uniref:ABC transporter substrate-binding protein n=1 Tax=Nocardiopsis sp. CNT312 TaxID=1137268 RepID=UPI00048F15D0|nr:ABC transporter substrate-binding protein [Nocardiopsis sp. CNT312]